MNNVFRLFQEYFTAPGSQIITSILSSWVCIV